MRLLADTHILLRAAIAPRQLSAVATALLIDPENEVFFSAASIWEIAIKSALGRADFAVDAGVLHQGLIENGYVELPIRSAHGVASGRLPALHRDPFDRIMIAQAVIEEMVLLTSDLVVAKYQGPIRLV